MKMTMKQIRLEKARKEYAVMERKVNLGIETDAEQLKRFDKYEEIMEILYK